MSFVRDFISEVHHRNELLFWFGLACLGFAVCLAIVSTVSNTQVLGVNAWFKPIKFSLSTTLLVWAMAWYMFYLDKPGLTSWYSWSVTLLLGFEILYIAWQAGRGELSHFNDSTAFTSGMFSLMAIAATVVSLLTAYIGLEFFWGRFEELPRHYLWGIRTGIMLFVVFSLQGFLMGSSNAHTLGGEMGGPGLPFLNWSTVVGDGRVAHFIGMHALQVLPILSFYVLKTTRLTLLAAIFYGILAFFTLMQAIQGKTFIKM